MTHFKLECVKLRCDHARDSYGKFLLEPLHRGQGLTVGNALRRVLLSDLEGSSIVAVRIAGVNHEFSTVPGVREDVLEIVLNLKEVVFKHAAKESLVGRLKIQGPSVVTAANFELPFGLEVVDSTQYIATICNDSVLEMEFKIEHGRGYHLTEKGTDDVFNDFLQIDAVFMPVKKVAYTIEEILGAHRSVKDRLILEIWTNGSITPQEALSRGSTVLVNLFNPLKVLHAKVENSETLLAESGTTATHVPIEELHLSVRAYNCLKKAGIVSVADLLDYSQEDLLGIKNFGQKSAEEVIDALQKRLGITLPKEIS